MKHQNFINWAINSGNGRHKKQTGILSIILVVVSLLAMLTGCFGGDSYEDALEQYILGITGRNGEIMCELLPDALVDALLDEGYGTREELETEVGKSAGEEFAYGIVSVNSFEICKTSDAGKDDLKEINEDLAELGEEIGKKLKATDARTAQVNIEFTSSFFGRQTTVVYLTMYKIDGEWCYLPM